MIRYLTFIALLFSSLALYAQQMEWTFMHPDSSYENCDNNTDAEANMLCYALRYTAAESGQLANYTTGFFINCIDGENPILSNSSCLISDNSTEINGCDEASKILMNCSGNSGAVEIIQNIPVLLHMVCFELTPGNQLEISTDEITGLTVSLISRNDGNYIFERPSFSNQNIAPQITSVGSKIK